MSQIRTEVFAEAITSLLEEIHVGPPDPKATWITSNEADSGFLGTLDKVSAGMASRPPAPGLNTIASHASHLLYALSLAYRAARGEKAHEGADWAESWRIQTVDEAGWSELKDALRHVHGQLMTAIRGNPPWDNPDLLKGIIALVGHGAYHLGAMRSIYRQLEGR